MYEPSLVTGLNSSLLNQLYGMNVPQPVQPNVAQELQPFQVAGDVVPFPSELARPPSGTPVPPSPMHGQVLQIDPLMGGVPQSASPTVGKGKVDWERFESELGKMLAEKTPPPTKKEMDAYTSFANVMQSWAAKNKAVRQMRDLPEGVVQGPVPKTRVDELRAAIPGGYKAPGAESEVAEGVMKGKIKTLTPGTSRKPDPLAKPTPPDERDASPFTSSLKSAEEIFSSDAGSIHKLQKSGRWPTYIATHQPSGDQYQFKSEDKALRWLGIQIPGQRPEPAGPNERPPWE
jgi:hypothetical protein